MASSSKSDLKKDKKAISKLTYGGGGEQTEIKAKRKMILGQMFLYSDKHASLLQGVPELLW